MLGLVKPETNLKIYDFIEQNQDPKSESAAFATDITGVHFVNDLHPGKDVVIVGTMGGTTHVYDHKAQKSVAKLSGHLIAPKVFIFDKTTRFLISGAEDTNVKIWDMRNMARQSLTTLKSHQGSITCLVCDSRILISGAEDGTLKIWDFQTYKLIKTLKVGTSEASYPLCVSLNDSLGFAVGLLNKTVKYYNIDLNQSNNPANWSYEMVSQTSIDTHRPRFIEFY